MSQTKKRIQFMIGSPAINSRHVRIVMIGASKPPGARKRARPVRLAVPQDQHAARDQRERKQRADIRKIGERADVQQARRNADHESRHPRGKIRRAESCVHAAEYSGQQSVARHGEPDARLPKLKNEQRRNHAHQRSEQYHQFDAAKMQPLHRVDHRRRIVN